MENELVMKNTGGRKSPEDYRDIQLSAVVPLTPEPLPESCFIDVSQLPHWNQKKIGSCVGHAWAKTQQKNEYQETGTVIPLSARFLYALAKSKDDYTGEGTYPRLVGKILKDTGCCTENFFPNNSDLTHADYIRTSGIPAEAYEEAKKYQIEAYAFVDNTEEQIKHAIKMCRDKRQGMVMLIQLDDSFWTDVNGNITWDKNKILPIRAPKKVVSGHEVFPYGYDYKNGRLVIYFFNSWSEAWGDNGNGWFYYDEYQQFILEMIVSTDKNDDWLKQVENLPSPNAFKHFFIPNIRYGEKSAEVKALQTALKIDGDFPKEQMITGYYGDITAKSVKLFQYKYRVASSSEIEELNGKLVGPKTVKQLNKLFNK